MTGAALSAAPASTAVRGRGLTRLPALLLEQLALAGTWIGRAQLVASLPGRSPVAIEGALADLVSTKQAEYRQNVGYRLAGSVEARMAARVAKLKGIELAGVVGKHDLAIGVAQDFGDDGLVLYEEEVPVTAPLPARERLLEIGVRHVVRLDLLLHKPADNTPKRRLRARVLNTLQAAGKPQGATELAMAMDLLVWEITPALDSAEHARLVVKGRDGCYRLTERFDELEVS